MLDRIRVAFSSLASIVAALAAPVATLYFLGWVPSCGWCWHDRAAALASPRNIGRLMNGTERRIRLSRGA